MAERVDFDAYVRERWDPLLRTAALLTGDAHAADGYCKVMKKAIVSGEIKKGKFVATSFKYVD